MQIDASEVLANLEEDTGLVEPDDGIGEVKLLENYPGVIREMGNVILQVRES